MYLELFVATALLASGQSLFVHFEERTPPWRRFLKVLLFVALTAALSHFFGRAAALAGIFGLLMVGMTFHVVWTVRHGIHPLTAEPRKKYYQLRGWEWPSP